MAQLNFDILSLTFIKVLRTSSSLSTLRSVNRAWYEITERTPWLWTSLVLNRKAHFTDLEYAQFYLDRSGALPIDVHIALPDDVDMSEIGDVTVLLRGQALRFRSFGLHVRIHDELEAFISSIAQGMPAPLLEYLELRVRSRTPSDTALDFISLPTAFTPAPRLAHIEIPGWPLPKSFPQLSTITSFTIDGVSSNPAAIHKIISFLGSTPSLQHFVYKGYDDYELYKPIVDSNFRHSEVHLPDLLTVDFTAPGSGAHLLCLVNAPALTDARFDRFHADNSLAALLLSKRSINLQRLTLEYTEFHDPLLYYQIILSNSSHFFPQLEEVLLIATDITDEVLMAAGERARSGSSLKKLELRDCERVTGTGLLEFVRAQGSDFSLSLQGCKNLNITQEDMVAISAMVKVKGLH